MTETFAITDESVESGLKALVDEAGSDFIYTQRPVNKQGELGCTYVHQGKPDCIVGQFLHDNGVPLERLEVADRAQYGAGIPADDLIRNLQDEGLLTIESWTAVNALREAQYQQDEGKSWGVALQNAIWTLRPPTV